VAALAAAATAQGMARHGGVRVNVYTVDTRTGHVAMVTSNPESEEDKLAYAPSWSPDAKRIVYAETRCHACSSEIRITRVLGRPGPAARRRHGPGRQSRLAARRLADRIRPARRRRTLADHDRATRRDARPAHQRRARQRLEPDVVARRTLDRLRPRGGSRRQ